MKKVDTLEGTRYYQNDYGMFLDIERHEKKTDLRLGTTASVMEPAMTGAPVAARDICCQFAGGKGVSDEECLKAFGAVYWNYVSTYIFYNVSDELGINPHESFGYKRLAKRNPCKMKITRYKHRHEKKTFCMDVEVCRDPKFSDVWTYIYIMENPGYHKVLCDRYAYEVPEDKYKEILEENLEKYIEVLCSECNYQEYCIPFHEKPDA